MSVFTCKQLFHTTEQNSIQQVSVKNTLKPNFFPMNNATANESFYYSGFECYELWQDPYYPESSMTIQLTFLLFYSIILIMGITSNTAVVIVTANNPSLHNPQNFFIMNMSIAALCACVFSVPFSAVQFNFKRWFFGEWMCRAIPWAQAATILVNTSSLCAIAVDRVHLICYSSTFRPRRVFAAIGCIWVLSMLIPIPYTFHLGLNKYDGVCGEFCEESWGDNLAYKNIFTFSLISLQFAMPLCVIVVCYTKIFSELSIRAKNKERALQNRRVTALLVTQMSKFSHQLSGSRLNIQDDSCSDTSFTSFDVTDPFLNKKAIKSQRKHKRRNTRVLALQVGLFTATKLPSCILGLYMDLSTQGDPYYDPFKAEFNGEEITFMYLVSMVMHCFSMMALIANPVIYMTVNQTFRDSFKATISRQRKGYSIPSVSVLNSGGSIVRRPEDEVSFLNQIDHSLLSVRPCQQQQQPMYRSKSSILLAPTLDRRERQIKVSRTPSSTSNLEKSHLQNGSALEETLVVPKLWRANDSDSGLDDVLL